jgi:hypothetical protein
MLKPHSCRVIYTKQANGFIDKERPDYICKLNKSIYGFKQAARCWNIAIGTFLLSNGYRKCGADAYVYMKSVKREDGKIYFVIIAFYVDDTQMLKEEKLALANRFKVEDLGELHYILGMAIKQNHRIQTLSIIQAKYLEGV